jgi:hypothetical protein
MDKKGLWDASRILNSVLVVLYVAGVFATSLHLYDQLVESNRGGFHVHIHRLEAVVNGERHAPHVGFHYLTFATSQVLGVSIAKAGGIVLASANVASVCITMWILASLTGIRSLLLLIPASLFVMIATAIVYPFFPGYIVMGNGTASVWINSTMILVRPFALLSFHWLVPYLNSAIRPRWPRIAMLAVLLFLSVMVKPSFLLVLLPAVGLYLLLTRRLNPAMIRTMLLVFSLALGLLAWQYVSTFGGWMGVETARRGVAMDLFRVWEHKTRIPGGVIVSVLLTMAFPIAVTLIRWRSLANNPYLAMVWLMVLFGVLERGLLKETTHTAAGNWAWGLMIALSPLFIYSLAEFINWVKGLNRSMRLELALAGVCMILIALHAWNGMLYLNRWVGFWES